MNMQLSNRLKRLEQSRSGVFVLIEDEHLSGLSHREKEAYLKQANPRGLPVVTLEPDARNL